MAQSQRSSKHVRRQSTEESIDDSDSEEIGLYGLEKTRELQFLPPRISEPKIGLCIKYEQRQRRVLLSMKYSQRKDGVVLRRSTLKMG
jgi:hypothetical protein